MNEVTFLHNFKDVANAPGGVQRLRELVLQLAATGRLVPRVANEGDSESLAVAICDERERLADEGGLRLAAALPDVDSGSQSVSVPDHWRWIRLGNLASKIGSGSTPRGGSKVYVNDGIPFLRSQNIWNDGVRLDDVVFISAETHGKMRNTHVKPNDILLNITGASLGRCAIAPVDFPAANVSQHVTIIRPLLTETRHFLHICLLAPLGQGMIWGRQVGMAREGLSKKVLEQFEIPLPPLEEQKRIVTKVDELMRLCDRLEAQQQEREKLLPLLSRANHARFVAKPTVSHLEPLFQRPRLSSTEDLRNTVLTLGVTGRLTQRLPGDDSAMTLLKEMQEQQTLLHQAIVGRNRTAVSNAVLPEWASKLPDSWETPHFDDVLVITSGITKGRNLAGRRTVRLPYLRVANVQRWQLSLEQMKEIEILEEERERYRLLRGDIVMIEGGDWDKLGRAAIWNEEIKDCVFQNHIFRVRSPDKTKLLPEWVMLFANSPLGREYFESCSKQTTNLASINMTQLRACRLPLPSTAEQKRIVDKVKYLLELVDRLDGKKSVAADTAQLFATAAVAAITSTEFTENERMKPPIIEVVTALKVGKKPKTRDVAPLATILLQTGGEASAKELWKQSDLLEIDAFYRQLKTEMAKGWITEPEKAFVKEVEVQ